LAEGPETLCSVGVSVGSVERNPTKVMHLEGEGDQFASCIGLLEDVDWQKLFNRFYEAVRMSVKCTDASEISKERLFCVNKKPFKISIMVELLGVEKNKVAMGLSDGGGDSGSGNKDDEFDNADDLEDEEQKNPGGGGSKDNSNGSNTQ
jgi:hypothetical protein